MSLTEPCIRHAIAAVGALHEVQTLRTQDHDDAMSSALGLYSQAIQIAVKRPSTDASGSLPVLIVASIVFTCFEFLREDSAAAFTHIKSGINLLKASREKSDPLLPWGRDYPAFEKFFLESELAPILSSYHVMTLNQDRSRSNIGAFLNPVDKSGVIDFGEVFDTVHQARNGLTDLLCTSIDLARLADQRRMHPDKLNEKFDRFKQSHERWKVLFDDLTARRHESWTTEERRATDHVHIMWYSLKSGFSANFAEDETAWDAHKEDFEQTLRLAESLISNTPKSSKNNQRDLSSEVGFLASVHTVAWKCRWPLLRRRALDILAKIPRSTWTADSRLYHAIFTRVMEIEESALSLPTDSVVSEDLLPPAYARIHHYHGEPYASGGRDSYEVTFLSRPDGPDGKWHYETEVIDLAATIHGDEPYSPSPLPRPQPKIKVSNGMTRRILTILNSAAARSLP